MLITPFIVYLSNKIKSDFYYSFFIWTLLLLNLFFCQVSVIMEASFAKDLLEDMVVYGIAYTLPFAIGVRVKKSKTKSLYLFCFLLVLLFLLLCFNSNEVGNNPLGISAGYKFPPRPYFIVYGSLVNGILWSTKRWWGRLADKKFTAFVGQNTIWIYLWHIPCILIANHLSNNWVLKYIIVYSISLLIFSVQFKASKFVKYPFRNYLIG